MAHAVRVRDMLGRDVKEMDYGTDYEDPNSSTAIAAVSYHAFTLKAGLDARDRR